MEILETTKKVIDGKVVIELPHSFDNQDVRVTVFKDIHQEDDWANLPGDKRIEILQRFYGSDKFPNNKVGEYDVYNQ